MIWGKGDEGECMAFPCHGFLLGNGNPVEGPVLPIQTRFFSYPVTLKSELTSLHKQFEVDRYVPT